MRPKEIYTHGAAQLVTFGHAILDIVLAETQCGRSGIYQSVEFQ